MAFAKVLKLTPEQLKSGETTISFVPFKRIQQMGGYTNIEVAELTSYSILRISDFEEIEEGDTSFYRLVSVNYMESTTLHLAQNTETKELALYNDSTGYNVVDKVKNGEFKYEELEPRKIEVKEAKVEIVEEEPDEEEVINEVEAEASEPEEVTEESEETKEDDGFDFDIASQIQQIEKNKHQSQPVVEEEPDENEEEVEESEEEEEESTGSSEEIEETTPEEKVEEPKPIEPQKFQKPVGAEKHRIEKDPQGWKKNKKNKKNRNNFNRNNTNRPFPKGLDESIFDSF